MLLKIVTFGLSSILDIHIVNLRLSFADKMVRHFYKHSPCTLGGSGLVVDFENCTTGDIISTEKEALARLRIRSVPLQDGGCFHIKEGELILAMHRAQLRSLFFDAEVEKVYFVPLNMYCCSVEQILYNHCSTEYV